MASPTCAKCEGHTFQRGHIVPLGEQRGVSVLHCAACGTVAAVLDSQAAIENLQKQVASIDAGLIRIVKAMQEL
ncbi:hypothetical protein ACQR0Z_10275 [Bradyrhizobium sp. HKCCYLS3077]|uniref:hypothetical protein n=1 Tax=Bradyrhizobium sp. HKCCYLS3077 TaxID=3420761 RepID=UPI003EBEA266